MLRRNLLPLLSIVAAAPPAQAQTTGTVVSGLIGLLLSQTKSKTPAPAPFATATPTAEAFDREAYERKLAADAARNQAEADKMHAAEREAAKKAWEAQVKREADPNTYAQRIRNIKVQISNLQRMISREREIGAVSGFVNKENLYMAGRGIVGLREQMYAEYRTYRAKGGRRALADL